jgi:group I intron endonuclease
MIKQAKIYRTPGIYKIQNVITKDFYIGSSMNVYKRMYQHQTLLRNNKHHSPHLQHAWNKYGIDNFEYIVLEYVNVNNQEDLFEIEQRYLNELCPKYNASKDARSSLSTKYTTRSKSHINKVIPQNRPNWNEVKQKISNTVKSLWSNPEFREHQLSCMNSETAKENYSKSVKLRWEDPSYRDTVKTSKANNFLSGKPRCNQSRGIQEPNDVINIRKLYDTGKYTYEDLAERFRIGSSTVRRVVKRESWDFIN